MKKINIVNNGLLLLFLFLDMLYLIISFDTSKITYKLICISFIVVILLPKIIKWLFNHDLGIVIELSFTLFIILAQFFGCILHFYSRVYWYDSFVHFLSGVLSSFLGIIFFVRNYEAKKKKTLFSIIFIISFSMFIAYFWELFEFSSDKIFNGDTQKVLETGVSDTMKDIFCAFLGSLLVVGFYIKDKFLLEKILK